MAIFQFEYTELEHDGLLSASQSRLLKQARACTTNAYAPYSHFHVGAAVLMKNNKIVEGVNIENASYPVGICAERSALASAISQFPKEEIISIAISYHSELTSNEVPAFPCGMCRQFISECEDRNQKPIELILSGQTGKVYIINSIKDLLPFSFSGNDLSNK